jgi:hypothetical protein
MRPGIAEPDEAKCLYRIEDTLVAVKEEYAEAEKVLKIFQAELDDGTWTFLWWIFS